MTDQAPEQRGHHRDHETTRHEAACSWRNSLHKDWRVWVTVVVTLGAMAIYLMTLGESILPDGAVEPPVPAAPAV